MKPETKNKNLAWVVAVDMGYGHQRAAYPLRHLAKDGVLNANIYRGIPSEDKKLWQQSRMFYEFISRFKKVPLVGEAAFALFDHLQEIPKYYPKRDLSQPTFQLKRLYSLIEKKQWGKHLIRKLERSEPLPLITTFFVPAFMAEIFKYPGDIYLLVTDSDMSRMWVPLDPRKSEIKFLAPSYRVAKRLRYYGARSENIFLTGFPLPTENLGSEKLEVVKADLGKRLYNLDPRKKYLRHYYEVIEEQLGKKNVPKKASHPLTVTFAIGGAGAQRELGAKILKSLQRKITQHEIRLVLVSATHHEAYEYFKDQVKELGLTHELGKYILIVDHQTKHDAFVAFNKILRQTDILWTKPSELSFYTALGLPIVMSDPIGSQEKFNQRWLTTMASGTTQEDPAYAEEWLFDWLNSGWFAEAAMQGFLQAPKFGTFNIQKILEKRPDEARVMQTILQF